MENIPSISMEKIRMVLELFLMNILVQMSTLEQSLVKKVIEQKVNDEFDALASRLIERRMFKIVEKSSATDICQKVEDYLDTYYEKYLDDEQEYSLFEDLNDLAERLEVIEAQSSQLNALETRLEVDLQNVLKEITILSKNLKEIQNQLLGFKLLKKLESLEIQIVEIEKKLSFLEEKK
jgi:hypothetical protein